jgi:hypothetical protein
MAGAGAVDLSLWHTDRDALVAQVGAAAKDTGFLQARWRLAGVACWCHASQRERAAACARARSALQSTRMLTHKCAPGVQPRPAAGGR